MSDVRAAGVVEDGTLERQSWARFEVVLGPKVQGAWLLHCATRLHDLDHFVMFSSASAVFGAPGLSGYAAANSYLDALAHQRKSVGLRAVSIEWGVWSEVGMAATLGEQHPRKIAESGIGSLSSATALDALDRLLAGNAARVAVVPIDWSRIRARVADGDTPPILTEVAGQPVRGDWQRSTVEDHRLSELLAAADSHDRRDVIEQYVREQVVRVLALDPTAPIDPDQGLSDIGMDSLMAVELINRMRTGTGLALPSTLAFEYPTLSGLVEYLATGLGVLANPPVAAPSVVLHRLGAAASGMDKIVEMSEEEAELVLLKELDDAGY